MMKWDRMSAGRLAALALLTATAARSPGQAAPPADGRPASEAGPAPDRRPPAPAGDVRRALDDLALTPEQRATVDPAVEAFQRKQRDARAELLQAMKRALTPEQYERFAAAASRPGPPPRGDRPPAPAGGGRPQPPAAAADAGVPAAIPAPAAPSAPGEQRLAVTFAGGHDTDPRDGGRPVALVAAGLGVPDDVFRQTFANVRPAAGGREPEPDQVRKNKAALMQGLSKYGVTNDRLDEVSNYYRYAGFRGQTWRSRPAAAFATVRDGKLTGLTVTDAGAGYTTPPTVTVEGRPDLTAAAALAFGKDLATNGSVRSLTPGPADARPR
jgi:hypothetical protein